MTDTDGSAPPGGNKTPLILIAIVALLLVVIVAIVVAMQQNKRTVTQDNTGAGTGASTESTAAGGAMPGLGMSTGAEFDPATATKVTAASPEEHVTQYYQAILDKKWDVAFEMQPAASQANGTVGDFEQTQTSYGMTAFKILSADEQGDTATVEVEQDLGANGTWGAIWTFVKHEGGWVVQSRKVQMK